MIAGEATEGTSAVEQPLLGGRYRLGTLLGRGSGATVYEAADTTLERTVTVKLFDGQVARDPRLRARFQQQAAKAARLRHPRVVAVLDAGFATAADGEERPFVVTEPGGALSLRTFLERTPSGRLEPSRAVELVYQLTRALAYAHSQGVVHADVKPENVLVDERGENARLVDFSLSFVSAATGVITPETIARRAAYLAPEQVRGDAVGPVTDVYGLGALLYELVAGRPPFVGPTPRATAERRVIEHANPAGNFDPSLPPALDALISRALERAPLRRWPSMEAFGEALQGLAAGDLRPRDTRRLADVEQHSYTPPPPRDRAMRDRIPKLLPLLVTLAVLAFAIPTLLRTVSSFSPFTSAVQRAEVPDVRGLTLAEARQAVAERGYDVTVIAERPAAGAAPGTIVQQAPAPGFRPDSEGVLRVTVSAGAPSSTGAPTRASDTTSPGAASQPRASATVPDVRGKTMAEAQAILASLGWRIGKVDPAPNGGTKIALQYPAPGVTDNPTREMAVALGD